MFFSSHQTAIGLFCCCSVTKSCPTLRPHGLQHSRRPCPSPSPGVCSDSCPLSWWCYLTISSSAAPILLLPSVFPSLRIFSSGLALHIRWPKYWSFSFSISPSNEYSGLISLVSTGLISLLSKGLSRVFSSTTARKHQFFSALLSLWSNSPICIHDYWKKIKALTVWSFVGKVMSLLYAV